MWKSGGNIERSPPRDKIQHRGQNPVQLPPWLCVGRAHRSDLYRQPRERCYLGLPSPALPRYVPHTGLAVKGHLGSVPGFGDDTVSLHLTDRGRVALGLPRSAHSVLKSNIPCYLRSQGRTCYHLRDVLSYPNSPSFYFSHSVDFCIASSPLLVAF